MRTNESALLVERHRERTVSCAHLDDIEAVAIGLAQKVDERPRISVALMLRLGHDVLDLHGSTLFPRLQHES